PPISPFSSPSAPRGLPSFPTRRSSDLASPDPALQMALARVYNDWVAEVFVPHPERFAAAAVIPMGDLEAAVGEARRAAKLGLRRSEEHTSELQSRENLVCRLLLEKKKL